MGYSRDERPANSWCRGEEDMGVEELSNCSWSVLHTSRHVSVRAAQFSLRALRRQSECTFFGARITCWVTVCGFHFKGEKLRYVCVVISPNPISKLCPAGDEGQGDKKMNSLGGARHTCSFQLPGVTLRGAEVWSAPDKEWRLLGVGFSRDKDGEKLRENSDSYSGMYLSEGGRGGGGGGGCGGLCAWLGRVTEWWWGQSWAQSCFLEVGRVDWLTVCPPGGHLAWTSCTFLIMCCCNLKKISYSLRGEKKVNWEKKKKNHGSKLNCWLFQGLKRDWVLDESALKCFWFYWILMVKICRLSTYNSL